MKIIKHGTLKPRYFICRMCRCEFIADPDEYTLTTMRLNATDYTMQFFTMACPECGKIVHGDKEVELEEYTTE